MNPFSSGTRLRDMIRAIRACKTAAEERAVVRKECAAIRAAIDGNDQDYRQRNMSKLMFIHMLGYPTHFGQMECLKLISSPGFPEKRIGYLGLMLLVDERQEVLMLVTNSLKQDLNHTNQYIVGLALCALGNICSAEMARDLAPEVERLLQFRDPNIRKKAALCSIRIIKKVPDLAENFVNPATALLREKHHGVLITGVQLCTELCKVNSEALEHTRKKCTEGLVRTLKDLANSPYSPEYDIAGITDPFLHIKLLRLLRALGEGDADASDSMNDILAQVATKTESNKVAGNAILYECVQTIMSIEDNGGLRVLAINILGRFLSNRDNNIRYVALNMLMKAVTADAQAVQRHRATILECVKDSDASIRKRALELVYVLVNETNVQPLTKELVDYLEVSDQDFREELTTKICSIVSKFSSDKLWYIDQMLKILSKAGNFLKDEVWHALIVVISNASKLHGYTVRALYKIFQTSTEQETFVRVAMWCIGEYGDLLIDNVEMLDIEDPITVTESDAVDVVELALKRHASDLTTKEMALVALLKLSSRFPSCSERIREVIIQYRGNLVLELQQRSIEFNSIIAKHQNISSTLVERMPVLDEATFIARRRAGSLQDAASIPTGPSVSLPNGIAKAVAPLVDLLDLSADDTPAPSSSGGGLFQDLLGGDSSLVSQQSGATHTSKNGTDVLLDLLSIGSPSSPIESPPAQNNSSTIDILSPSTSKREPLSSLDDLSSVSLSSRASTNAGAASMTDFLDGFASGSPASENNGLVYPSITAFESSSLRLTFNLSKQPGSPHTTNIQATFTNLSSNAFTDFVFQAAVPKFLQLLLDPASGNTLPSNGKGSITQNLSVTNSQHGKKSLVMRIRITYKINGKDTLEEGQISNFPRDL
ncbi:AP-1 complex subunit gamma-2-like [Cicer arietinum]|uniref:AP-1 complex subunit gamma n=1 Tax=Cicer arietinum TaxID=3827 RepID=A0A1S2YTW5_CICAR|nr:AP-1 complex subunit gamma-2-like [Cicer arietinum]XP_004509844.1 AP-1 complex subunit gamma-2-like [Cicer arietinum]XP_012573883.1 AP-1 complex subunit gamma-2-like [Cicer arietinum]